jgi:hypothetical protein
LKCSTSQEWLPIVEKINQNFAHWGSQWLNPTIQIIPIKVIIYARLIYQCSAFLTTKRIIDQPSMKLREFLWQGGKGNKQKSI